MADDNLGYAMKKIGDPPKIKSLLSAGLFSFFLAIFLGVNAVGASLLMNHVSNIDDGWIDSMLVTLLYILTYVSLLYSIHCFQNLALIYYEAITNK